MKKHVQKIHLIFALWISLIAMGFAKNTSQYTLELTLHSHNNDMETCQINFKKLNPDGSIYWQKVAELNTEHNDQEHALLLNLPDNPSYWKQGVKLFIECEYNTQNSIKIILLQDGYKELSILSIYNSQNTQTKRGTWISPKNTPSYTGPVFKIPWILSKSD